LTSEKIHFAGVLQGAVEHRRTAAVAHPVSVLGDLDGQDLAPLESADLEAVGGLPGGELLHGQAPLDARQSRANPVICKLPR
jgi:hypothetical protein